MAYIIERKQRFYVVAYDGIDTLTGRERRRWHSAGRSQVDAEAIAATLERTATPVVPVCATRTTFGVFLAEQWMPRRRTQLGQTTAHRYAWMIDNYINPRIGDIPLRSLRVEHLDGLYHSLLTTGSRDCGPLASKAVYDVHVIVRSSLADAVRRHLVDTNVALAAHAPRSTQRAQRTSGSTQHSISPHTRACAAANSPDSAGATGTAPHIASRSHAAGKSSAAAPSKSPSRPAPVDDCVDLDPGTEQVLERWRHTQHRDGHPGNLNDPVFTNSHGQPVHAESISQLFDRHLARTDIPRIRFHDLRHTPARLLVAAGTPIKVVSERLGHGHPGFTMATYQHLVPGMSATAATDFANLIATHRDDHLHLAGAH